jgi:glycosyltransferase involved in cell wall biosynthesis
MPEMIAVCDVCVAPFLANTFFYFSPLKMFEYMAMGKPIVASRLGQIVELLQDGRAGVLVPPGDIEALVNALVQLEADTKLRADLSEAAYRASLKHTWKANVSAVVETMDHVRGRSAKTTGRWIRGR